jgi:hypothetical protein
LFKDIYLVLRSEPIEDRTMSLLSLDALRTKGIAVTPDPEIYPNGRFARWSDPEENPIAEAQNRLRGASPYH